MKISLRPHHFLCLQGYKGHNYSSAHKMDWEVVYKNLKDNPQTDILIISGADDLCSDCPNKNISKQRYCKEENVKKLDEKIKAMLGIVTGETYNYKEINEKLKNIMNFQKHKELCSTCCWWKKGLCRDSFNSSI